MKPSAIRIFGTVHLLAYEQYDWYNLKAFYGRYGSKEHLYKLCLERFVEIHGGDLSEKLKHPDFRTAVANFFRALVERQRCADVPSGCFATFAAIETGGSASEASRFVQANLDAMRELFQNRCLQAVADEQLPGNTDCEAKSAMLLAMTRGVAVLGRGHSDLSVAQDAVDGMLQSV
ncbi:MAG: hypothetical protein AAF217_12375 [Pseudomonadota bacterium]